MQELLGLRIREMIGWALIVVGLIVFRVCFAYLGNRQVVEAAVASMIGFFIFRGGMQLVRISIASRGIVASRLATNDSTGSK